MSKREEEVMDIAYQKGFKWGLSGFGAASAAMFYSYKRVPGLSSKIGHSAMSGLPLMAGIFAFTVACEQTLYDAHRHPENYGLEVDSSDPNYKPKSFYLSPFKVIMNQYIGKFILR